ncbi:hypothetical protein MMC08_007533 [Hypocenomyce scalaris]|nr:hypothetical protein [Hypocenomyce scalaris]
MAEGGVTPDVKDLDVSDADTDDLFASPSRTERKASKAREEELHTPRTSGTTSRSANGDSKYDRDGDREAALRRELAGVRSINEVIEGVVESLARAKGNMETVSHTVSNASKLLNTWTRILSQTEHNQRLILNPSWRGASQDVANIENESVLKQQAAERREIEEHQRREAAARKAEDEERRRVETAAGRATRGSRGRGRGSGKAGTNSTSGYVGVGGQGGVKGTARGGGTIPGRAGSGIGRGIGSGRGRGRGVI